MTAADKKGKGKKGDCLLFGHADVTAVERLGGKCYRVNRVPDKGGKKSRGNITFNSRAILCRGPCSKARE